MYKILLKILRKSRVTSNLVALFGLWRRGGYLAKKGWFSSFQVPIPIDADGQPLPWFTYPAIDFLQPRLNKDMSVFEYGSGNSTLWWGVNAGRVVCCEHDIYWYERLKDSMPQNVESHYAALAPEGHYAETCQSVEGNFDIIVIDGREQIECCKYAMQALTPNGIIVWDNSDRDIYQEGYDYLMNQGFKRLDFWGIGPMSTTGWCTSIFYRAGNCVGI